MTRALAIVIGVLASLALGTEAQAEDRALVIGINAYPELPDRQLLVAASDARRFAAFLVEDYGFKSSQVTSLIDREATRERIITTFRNWLVRGTKTGDRAVFYFSGHGLRLIKNGADTNALAPSDVAKAESGARVEYDNVIFSDELTALRHELMGRRVLFVVDSCYSGKIARENSGGDLTDADPDVRIKTLTPDAVGIARSRSEAASGPLPATPRANTPVAAESSGEFALWAAVAPNQVALEDLKSGGGVFTSALLAGLKDHAADANRNGRIEVGELLNYVAAASKSFCADHRRACPDGLTPDLHAAPNDSYRTSVFWPFRSQDDTAGSGFEVTQAAFAHQNDFDLALDIVPGATIPLGDPLSFRVTSAERGRLLLFDQESSGAFRQVFPNRFSTRSKSGHLVPKRTPMEVPRAQDGFRYVAGSRGKSVAMALVVADEVNFEDLTRRFETMEVITDPKALVGAIAARLQAPIVDARPDVPDRRARWAFAWIEYDVR